MNIEFRHPARPSHRVLIFILVSVGAFFFVLVTVLFVFVVVVVFLIAVVSVVAFVTLVVFGCRRKQLSGKVKTIPSRNFVVGDLHCRIKYVRKTKFSLANANRRVTTSSVMLCWQTRELSYAARPVPVCFCFVYAIPTSEATMSPAKHCCQLNPTSSSIGDGAGMGDWRFAAGRANTFVLLPN